MLIFACSDKGGTGRTVTICNMAFQLSMSGKDVAYLDFDFGSPTAGAVFEVTGTERGVNTGGLHSHLLRGLPLATIDIRKETGRRALREQPSRAGRLVLVPGDRGGGEFGSSAAAVERIVKLLIEMEAEFSAVFVDLSAGRSAAVQMALHALAAPELAEAKVRWLLFHRWTRQHLLAANGLLFDERGILEVARSAKLDVDRFLYHVRTIRTVVPDLRAPGSAISGPQATWLQECDQQLDDLARDLRLGSGIMLGSTPMEPMLQYREQLILPGDVVQGFASRATERAFAGLAADLVEEQHWTGLDA